jgi:YD repeat-containing protein
MSFRKMSCSCFLVLTLLIGLFLPFSMFPKIALANAATGSSQAGIKGYSFEIATLTTSQWTSILADIKDGNLMLLAKPLEIMGLGKQLTFEMMYNSVNRDLDLGLGKGWTCNLFEMVKEDPSSHHVTYVNKTGAKMVFTWDSSLNQYISPKGFEGTLIKQTDGTYVITDWNYMSINFDGSGKLTKFSSLNVDLITIQYNAGGVPVSITDALSSRTITFTWSQNHITEARDAMNQTWKLNYSGDYTKLLSLEKPDQNKAFFAYDADTNLISQKDFLGQSYAISYISTGVHAGKIATISLPTSGVYEFTYDNNVSGFSSKTQIEDPESFTTSYFFGSTSQHLEKISMMDGANEIKTTYQYDTAGFITAIGDSYNQSITYTRDANHQIIDISYPPATIGGSPFQIQYTYDPLTHLKIQKREKINATPVWAVTFYEYTDPDCLVKPSKITDPLGTETTYDYNANHQIISITTGTGPFSMNFFKTRVYTYAVSGNPATYTDPEGNMTLYTQNANGFISTQMQFEGPSQNGQLVSNLTYEYDSSNRPADITNTIINVIAHNEPNANGIVTTSSSFGGCSSSNTPGTSFLLYPNSSSNRAVPGSCLGPIEKAITQISVPSLGVIPLEIITYKPRQTSVTDSSNHTSIYEYFGNGTMKKETDYLGRVSTVALDSLGRIGKITDSNNKEITFAYDLDNRMISKNEEGIGNYTYVYDKMSRIVTTTDPIRGSVNYSYNLLSNLLSDEKGFYSYDLKGNRLTANYFNGSSDTWNYSREGYLLSKNGDLYTTDKLGDITQIETEYGNASLSYLKSLGQITQITGTGDLGSYNMSFTMNNRLESLTDSAKNNVYHYAWNENATLAQLQYANQTVQTYTYQGKHPDEIIVKKGQDTLFSSSTDFNNYDQANLFSYGFTENQQTHNETTTASYDSLGRTSTLSYASDNQTIQYNYSASTGAISAVSVSGQGTYAIDYTTSGRINSITYPNNSGTEYYSYNGNMGRISTVQYPNNRSLSFTWNSKNQITQIFGTDNGNIFSYNMTYDRLGKMKNYTKSENGMQSESWLFSYGLFGLEKASRNLYGIQDITMDFTTDFSGRILSATYQQMAGFAGEIYFHYDNYGNTAILTNSEGIVVAGYLYKMHNGKTTYIYNPLNIVNPLTCNSRAGYMTLNAFNNDLKIQVNSIGAVDLSGGFFGWVDLTAPAGGLLVAGNRNINITVNDSVSTCSDDCEKNGLVKCCKEYRSQEECGTSCLKQKSANGIMEQVPSGTVEECIKKCTDTCKTWGCCESGASPSL